MGNVSTFTACTPGKLVGEWGWARGVEEELRFVFVVPQSPAPLLEQATFINNNSTHCHDSQDGEDFTAVSATFDRRGYRCS